MDEKCVYVKITQTKNNKLEKYLSQVQGLDKSKRGGVNKQKERKIIILRFNTGIVANFYQIFYLYREKFSTLYVLR